MRLIAIFTAVMLAAAPPAEGFEVDPDGVFAARVTPITGDVSAPETTIDLADGGATSLSAYRGKVAIVVMWATWCHVCEVEMPILADVARRYRGRNLAVLPISVDEAPAEAKVAHHLEKKNLTIFPVMLDRHFALAGRIGLRGTPTTIVVDKFGQVVAAFEGQAPWSDPQTTAYIEALIAAGSAAESRAILGALN